MDKTTRIGLGGTALAGVAGLAQPIFGWWVTGPFMAIGLAAAVWGFWPILTGINLSLFSRCISLHIAAQRAYEAAEKASVLHLYCGSNDPPEKKLQHFKLLLLVHDKTQIFAVKPPSTKSKHIPKSELIGGFDNYPMEGDEIGPAIPLNADPTYINATVARKGLHIVIKEIYAEGRERSC